ncbi:MAG: hypothetical protein MJ162_05190 [Treponema sp.]|nr:hypothetical protein [Treponema sp.]
MKRYIKNTAFLGFALFSIIATLSCEVGLGASVDTERPTLNITYPPKGAIIMDTFTLAGTVADDIGVSFINVTLTHKTLNKEFVYKSENGSVQIEKPAGGWAKGTHWTASLGRKDENQKIYNGWDLPDGEYFIDVEASDGVGSVYDRRSIKIDNTAPVFISENLTSLGVTEEGKLSPFGQKINLKGSAKDDSEILKVFFDVYDENKLFVNSRVLDYDMTSEGVLLAKYSSVTPSTENEKKLAENYNLIYGLKEGQKLPEKADESDRRHPYLVIRFADNARIYNKPVFEGEESEISGLGDGNISSELFLNTPAFGDEGITIDELNNYQKRLELNASLESRISNIADSSIAYTKTSGAIDFNKVNKLLIDPEINPKWNIDSYDQTSFDFNQVYLDSGLTVMFACGNDNTEFLPENICILLEKIEETEAGTGLFTKRIKSDAEIRAWAESWTDSSKDTEELIMLKETGTRSDGKAPGTLETAYVHDIKLDSPKLVVHNRYRLVVLGKDGLHGNGLDFSEQNRNWYGFHVVKETAAPKIEFKKEGDWVEAKNAEGAWIGPETENFVLEFKVTTSGESIAQDFPKVTYALADNNGLLVEEAAGKYIWEKQLVSDYNSNYEYRWTLKNADGTTKLWMPETEGNYKLVFGVEVKDNADGLTAVNYKLNMDRKNPVVNIKEVRPFIEGENGKLLLNGTVEIPVTVSDAKGIEKAEYFIQWDAINSDSGVIALDSDNSGVIVLDTSNVDQKEVVLKVKATDIFGNVKIDEKTYFVDQESDRPRIEISLNDTENISENNLGLSSGNTIIITIADDDGVNNTGCLRVYVWGIGENNSETPITTDWKDLVLSDGKIVWNYYDSGVITKDGKYKLQFEATDSVGTLPTSKSTTKKYGILVDGTSPKFDSEIEVKVDRKNPYNENGKYYIAKGKNVDISFGLEEGNLKSLKVGDTELKGTDSCKQAADSTTYWNVNYTWSPSAGETSGDKSIIFTASDDSQNSKALTVNLYYDERLPSISDEEMKIYPVINTNVVNGIIYLEGKGLDNDRVVNITGTVDYTAKDGSSKSMEFTSCFNGKFFEKTEIDTTEFEDKTSFSVTLTATDRAGNFGSNTKTFHIDQSTDKPVISFDSSKFDISLTSFEAVETANKNMFGLNTNNILSGTVSDDDGVGEVIVSVEGTTKKAIFTGKTTFNCNIKDDLGIDAAGNYILKINASDDVEKTKLPEANKAEEKTLYIVVDGVAPVIQNEKIGESAYASGIPVNGNFKLSFDVKEAHLSQVTVQLNKNAAVSVEKVSFDKDTGISHFEKEFTLSDSDKDSILSIKIKAEDLSGLSAEKELSINYDATAPEINASITRLLNGNKVNGNILISGTVKDEAGSGVTSETTVKLYKGWDSETNDVSNNMKEVTEIKNSETSFTYSVDTTKLFDNDNYKLKVTAKDKAGNPAVSEIKFTVDQSTDKPIISFVNANIDAEKDGISVFGSSGWTIDFAAEDDDGDVIVTANGVKVSSPYTIPEGDLRKSGTHTIDFVVTEAYEEDLASPLSEPYVLSFAIDTKSPEFVSQKLDSRTYYDNMYVKGTYDIEFTVDDDNGVEKLEYKSGDSWISTGISYSEDKKAITHSYSGQSTKDVITEYRLTDKYGFTSTKTLKYKVDSASPSLDSIVIKLDDAAYNPDKWFNQGSIKVSVSGIKDDNLNGTVSVAGDSSQEGESFVMTVENHVGSFSQTRSFSDGNNEVKYVFIDEAGNTAELPVIVKVDATAPTVKQTVSEENTVAYISASGVVTGKDIVKVNFTASDGSVDSVSGLATAVLGPKAGFKDSEKYTEAINLSSSGTVENKEIDFNAKEEGKHEIWVRVTDIAGNDSETKLGEFILDRTLPKVEYTSHSNNATVNKNITLKGTVKDENLGENPAAVLKCGEEIIGNSVSVTGTGKTRDWSFSLNTSDFKNSDGTFFTGSKIFTVVISDAAGNVSTDEISLNIDQDSDRPAIILDSIKTDGTTTLGSGKITGTVTDDDGISSFAIQVVRKSGDSFVNVVEENDGWKVVEPAANGKFEYEIPVEEENSVDGSYVVYFQVEDKSEAIFESTDNDRLFDLVKPRIYEKNGVTPVTTGVDFDVDGTSPVIDSIQVQVSSDNSNWGTAAPLATGVHYGGPKKRYAKLTITGSDNVLPTAQLNVSVSVNGISHSVSHDSASGFTYVIDFASMDSGSVPVEVSIADNSDGIPALRQVSITCDNSAPSSSNAIANFTPVSDDEVTGVVAVSATVNDDNEANSGINNVKYYVPLKTETIASESVSWSEAGVTLSDIVLRITLDSLSSNTTIDPKYSGYEIGDSEIYQIPVWFRVEDNCGNHTYVTDNEIRYNPNAARPKIKRTYPVENAVTLGGTIRMAGTAEDDVDIHSVYVQYDVDGDGFDNDDAIWLSGSEKKYKIFNVQSGEEIETVNAENLSGKTWGVKAEGTRSWNAEFDASALETNTPLKIRMLARDADQNTLVSAWTETLSVTVNNDLPQFSQFYLVQYDGSNNEIKRTPYETDKYVKGENWFLEGSVTDKNNIESVEQDKVALTTSTGLTAITKGYNLKLPVNPVGGKFSTILKATNANAQNKASKEEMYSVNIDNDAPAFEDGSSANDLVLYAGEYGRNYLNSSTYMQNSNGFTMVSGKVNEPGSGFTRAVFYLERYSEKTTSGDTTTYKKRRLFNVMTGDEINLVDKDGNEVEGAPTFNADGLPVGAEIDITKGSDNFSFTVGELNEYIRVGGLVIIGNVYKKIDTIDTENKVITVTEKIESAWTDNKQKAQFVYAFSVDKSDESRDESGNEKGGDGDGIVERITKQGSNYIWQASFDSSVIKDGPVELHVVVFDAAGNSRSGEVSTRISNNAPRITSVKLGTDLNHSGEVDESEYTQFYAFKNNWGEAVTDQGKDVWNLVPSRETESLGKNWKVVSGLNVIPEFVGGNGNIHYIFSKAEGTGDGKRLETAETGETEEFATINETTKKLDVSEIELDDDAIDSNGEDGVNTFRFSFWDSTEESTPGTDSGSCVLNVELYQDITDGSDPTATVSPFFWNKRKAGNNSVAWDTTNVNKPLGHIELEDDWVPRKADGTAVGQGESAATSGVYDADPKVSGTIVIRGTAYDETVLSKLVVTFDGIIDGSTTKCESKYTAASGTWSTPTGTGFTLIVVDSNGGVTQDGHSVNWELTLDTSKISGQTGLDKKVNVTAVDTNDATSTVADYKMDIVPYVTEVVTSLSSMKETNPSVYNRTATGHYPVQSVVDETRAEKINNKTSETITLKGFNLNGTTVAVTNGGTVTKNVAGQISFTAAALKSTALDCKVNGIPLMNNLNNNNASGSYKGKKNSSGQLVPVSDASADYDELYTYAYNRVPNDDNNNRLTDDIIFDVWEFNDRVVEPKFNSMGGTTMQVNSHNGLIQYAYSDGTVFAMASSANTRTSNNATSSTSWARGWDTIQEPSVGFHVDASGETVGAGQPGDTSKDDAIDAFALMTSRWGFGYSISSPGFMQYHTNLKFLETTGENRDSKLVINRQRFQSPAFASTKTTNSVNLYMVYYDAMHDEIRFRAGEVPANDGSVTQPTNITENWNMPDYDNGINYRTRSGSDSFGMFIDSSLPRNKTVISTPTWDDKRDSQVIASSSITNKGAGQYTSVAVSKNASSQDVVSAVWFDKGANALRYSYIVNPIGSIDTLKNNKAAASWTGNKTLFQNAGGGEYCQIMADVNGGIHVVAYAGNGYLYYAYAPNYSADFTECIVDATDGVGQHATLDVALNSAGNPIPYIGYYSTTGKAKHAYLTATAAAALSSATTSEAKTATLAGVDSNMTYTGAWESSIIPSVNTLSVRREDKINVGVWKETSGTDIGKIKASTTGTSTYGEKSFTIVRDGAGNFDYNRNYSITYGNGTANDVLLYQIVDSTGSKLNCLESAQMRGSE